MATRKSRFIRRFPLTLSSQRREPCQRGINSTLSILQFQLLASLLLISFGMKALGMLCFGFLFLLSIPLFASEKNSVIEIIGQVHGLQNRIDLYLKTNLENDEQLLRAARQVINVKSVSLLEANLQDKDGWLNLLEHLNKLTAIDEYKSDPITKKKVDALILVTASELKRVRYQSTYRYVRPVFFGLTGATVGLVLGLLPADHLMDVGQFEMAKWIEIVTTSTGFSVPFVYLLLQGITGRSPLDDHYYKAEELKRHYCTTLLQGLP